MQARCLNMRVMPASRVAGQQRASARAPLRVAFEQQRSLVKVFAEAEEAKEQEVVPEEEVEEEVAAAIAEPVAYQEEDRGEKFQERVVQIRRVTKVVKGGKQLSFRAVVVIGDENGQVGVGVAAAKEVIAAVQKAVVDAKRHLVSIPLTRNSSIPHRIDGISGAAKVMLRPAAEGTGVIAGGSTRVVLELAGIKNIFGKQLGSPNALNNARATVQGLEQLRTFDQVARERGLTREQLLGRKF